MDDMIISYKHILLENGLLALFEKNVDADDPSRLQAVRAGNAYFLMVGEFRLIPLGSEILDCIARTKRIYLAVGGQNDSLGFMKGYVEIDDISLGRLIAHWEVLSSPAENPV